MYGAELLGAGSSLFMLNQFWYNTYPRESFHFFDDNSEWLQMDKAGHAVTSFYLGKLGSAALKRCGMPRSKSAWLGGMLGSFYLDAVEVMDGFSAGWGFSWGDVAANTAGSLLCTSQELCWGEERLTLKVSYHATSYAQYRPGLLGSTPLERAFKDYNGQTYWLSLNIASFLKNGTTFPEWLDASFGYGAEGMIGGKSNPLFDESGAAYPVFERSRQFYFSLDADLWRIKKLPRFLKVFTETFGFIKIPFPALEFRKQGTFFRPFYF